MTGNKIDALVTCIRLFKTGYVTNYPDVVQILDENGKQLYTTTEGKRGNYTDSAYSLRMEEIGKLSEFARKVFPVISEGAFPVTTPALQFFNRGIDDRAREDYPMALVDFVVSMEALLSDSTEN